MHTGGRGKGDELDPPPSRKLSNNLFNKNAIKHIKGPPWPVSLDPLPPFPQNFGKNLNLPSPPPRIFN